MKASMRSAAGLLLACGCVLAAGCAAGKSDALPSYSETNTVKVTATVQAIDQATRVVTLKTANGDEVSFVAGEAVKNLAQVNAGDQVSVQYVESIAIEVRRADGSQPTVEVAAAADSARPGEKPAAAAAAQITISATVVAIDLATLRATVKGPQGNLRVVQARDAKKLANVKVGDMVFLTYSEAVGISVEKL